MIAIGDFFFKYRNWLFIVLYLALFIPSPPIFSEANFGPRYYLWPVIIGLVVTISGQLIRGATIGLDYIVRGGKEGKVYADDLVTGGIFRHCRNPLYVGNILMLAGVGILSNSLIYMVVFIPLFLFIYQAIVLAEENFLRNKFGASFEMFCKTVNRWVPDFRGIAATFKGATFKWKRWILKEHTTQYIWLNGIVLILLLKYPELTGGDTTYRNRLLIIIIPVLLFIYLFVRFMKKTGKMVE
jgi:protein-S-isoprenylcysteine O-methyltransferase Ste14